MTFASEIKARLGAEYKAAVTEHIRNLTKLGNDAIHYAYNKGHARGDARRHPYRDGKWRHRSYNLHDSFGSAVFMNGAVIQNSIRVIEGGSKTSGLSKTPDRQSHKTGREKLLEYFNKAHYGLKRGEIVLVCMVAMYYGGYLEKGVHKGRYKIQVISAARDFIDKNYKSYVIDKGRTLVKRYAKVLKCERIHE